MFLVNFQNQSKKNCTKKNRNLHQFYMPYLKISMEVGLKKRIWIFDINIFKYNQSNAVNFATHAVVTCSFLYKRGKQKSIYANERRKKFRKLGLFHTWKSIFAFLPCHSTFLRSREQNQQKFNLTRKKYHIDTIYANIVHEFSLMPHFVKHLNKYWLMNRFDNMIFGHCISWAWLKSFAKRFEWNFEKNIHFADDDVDFSHSFLFKGKWNSHFELT